MADQAEELADQFVDGRDIKFAGLLSSLLGGFVAVATAAGIQIVERFVLLQVWAIGGVADGAAALVRTVLGIGPATAVEAFSASYQASLMAGPLQPFLLVLNALVVVAIFGVTYEVVAGG